MLLSLPLVWSLVDPRSLSLNWLITSGGIFAVAVGGYALLWLVHHVYFGILPQRAIRRHPHGSDPEPLRRYLERVVATPAPLGPHHKLVVHGALIGIYLPQGRHAEAAEHCRAELACLDRCQHIVDFPALQASTRRRLADCLEALGDDEAAATERQVAAAALEQAPGVQPRHRTHKFLLKRVNRYDEILRHQTRGTFLERANRHAEAYEAFEQALAATPATDRAVRVDCMVHLLLAAYNAGRPGDCLRWAEEAIAAGATGQHLLSAHRMAGIVCGNLSRLADSEAHRRRAHDLAVAAGDRGTAGEVLGMLADILRKRGQLVAAHEAARQAEATDPKAVRVALAAQAEVLRCWGQFDEALAVLRRCREQTLPSAIPHYERRMQAVVALLMARLAAEAGQPAAARGYLAEADAELASDAKLSLTCATTAAWIDAAQGQFEAARATAADAESRLADFRDDPSTTRGGLHDLAIVAALGGDLAAAIEYWDRYLPLQPDPVNRPTAYYHRGECRRALGDRAGAKADFEQAVASNIDTHHARLARAKIRELGPI